MLPRSCCNTGSIVGREPCDCGDALLFPAKGVSRASTGARAMLEKDCDDATARPGAPERHRPGRGGHAAGRFGLEVCRQRAAQGAGSDKLRIEDYSHR